LPSVSALPFIRANAQARGWSALFIGNPATGNTQLDSLPYAEKEVQWIADLYGVSPLIGSVATESQIKEQVSKAGIVHLAAHGIYNPIAPLYSSIALASDEKNDGLLEVHEIYGLDLRKTNLVVLSACETQLGELSSGDELVGLTRAFFFAGTPTVVASLWSVNDAATSILMERFYTHMRAGLGKAEALRQAQIDVRAKYPNPYYWAGFVLSGDSGKINEPFSVSLPWVVFIIVVCAFIVVGILWVRHQRQTKFVT
jgi:CHAT domain-containing protein